MSAPSSHDAIVIGGGVNGLAAAAYLAKAGKKVLLLEKKDQLGGRCAPIELAEGFSVSIAAPTLYALDPLLVSDLKLSRYGLRAAGRELPLVGLRAGAKEAVLSRNIHDTAASIIPHSSADAATWPHFRATLFKLARAMRPLWWEVQASVPRNEMHIEIERILHTGASAWLDTWFESEALKAALCFDATVGGLSIAEPGSAMVLLWRAAQEMWGLQGATMISYGGLPALAETLVTTAQAAGSELRTGASVEEIILDQERVAGIRLSSGEYCFAPAVLSATSLRHTIHDLLPTGALGLSRASSFHQVSPLAEAHVLVAVANKPSTASLASRFIAAEKVEAYISAELAARSGEIGNELPIEFTFPTGLDPSVAPHGQHILSAVVRPLPRDPAGGWAELRPVLAAKVVAAIDRLVPNFSRDIAHVRVLTPDDLDADIGVNAARLTSAYIHRIRTPISGLFFCGVDAEPVSAISGRAGRLAAQMAMQS